MTRPQPTCLSSCAAGRTALVGLLLTAGCGPGAADQSAVVEAPPPIAVTLTLSPTLQGSRLRIAGTTDLPDGAVIVYEVRHERWATEGELQWFREGQVVVEEGAFSTRTRLRSWPRGALQVWASFQTVLPDGQQPPEVIATFGEMGERLAGDNVTQVGDMKRAEVTARVER